jgi:hypothetical protein
MQIHTWEINHLVGENGFDWMAMEMLKREFSN